jgi:hypothetical protein
LKPLAVKLPYQETLLIPAGCIHWPFTERKLLDKLIERVLSEPNAVCLLLGDSLDAQRTHHRDHLRSYRADPTSHLNLDRWALQEIEELAAVLEPIRHRILGTVLGNHYHEFSDGLNSEQHLARLLNIPYLGPTGIIRLELVDESNRIRDRVVVYAHHTGGKKSAGSQGADANGLMACENNFDADVFILGHTHRKFGFKVPKLGLTDDRVPEVVEVTKVFLRSGAFLKGYGADNPNTKTPHFPSYAESAAYRPTDLGFVELKIIPSRTKNGSKKEYLLTF